MHTFSAEAAQVLTKSGWEADRQVDTSSWRKAFQSKGIPMHDAAEVFLAEFGALIIDVRGSGISAARTPFELDPMLCLGEEDLFKDWSSELKHTIFPVGHTDGGRYLLGIDEEGKLYVVSNFLADLGRASDGLEKLILGVKADNTLR